MAVSNAIDCAHDGQVADGFTVLLVGRERAREIAEEGVSGAPELVCRREKALGSY